jgi:hypothetical protein
MTLIQKRCPKCEETLPAEDFYRNIRATSGLSTYCKRCHRELQRPISARNSKAAKQRNLEAREAAAQEALYAQLNRLAYQEPIGPPRSDNETLVSDEDLQRLVDPL